MIKKKLYARDTPKIYKKKKSLYVGLFTCSLRLLCLIAYCDILKESDCYTTVEPTISGRVLQVYQISIFFFFIECDYQCQMLFYFLSLFRSTSIFPGVVCLFYEASGFDFICSHVINVLLYQDSSLKIYSIGKDVRLQNDHFKR